MIPSSNSVARENSQAFIDAIMNTKITTDFDRDSEEISKFESHIDSADLRQSKSKHWLWDNWILLTLLSMASFATGNLLIGNLS